MCIRDRLKFWEQASKDAKRAKKVPILCMRYNSMPANEFFFVVPMLKQVKADLLRYHAPVWVCLLLTAVLLALPTGYEDNLVFQESDIQPALVLATDESTVIDTGLVRSGEQRCQLEVLGGQFKGQTVEGKNALNGSLEQDKIFAVGDKALVRINFQGEQVLSCLLYTSRCV